MLLAQAVAARPKEMEIGHGEEQQPGMGRGKRAPGRRQGVVKGAWAVEGLQGELWGQFGLGKAKAAQSAMRVCRVPG